MKTNLFDLRKIYSGKAIPRVSDPLRLFHRWFREAQKTGAGNGEPQAAVLSTIGRMDERVLPLGPQPRLSARPRPRPRSRFVLIKAFDSDGFIFFTNLSSNKGAEIKDNPYAALLFYWPELHRQVRIEGKVTTVSRTLVEKYFYSRPKESQVAAAVSNQSRKLKNRKELLDRYTQMMRSTETSPVLCPKDWGGFRIQADFFEFWSGMPNRLHDRVEYKKKRNGLWSISHLNP